MGISYYGSPKDFILHGYCDANYACDHDNKKSHTMYLFLLANGVVVWCNKRQGSTHDLTTTPEFVAMAKSDSMKEAIWLC